MKRHSPDHHRPPPMPLFQTPYGGGAPGLAPDPAAVAALSPELQYRFNERAAIIEFEAGVTRGQAEAQAWEQLAPEIRREKGGLPPRTKY